MKKIILNIGGMSCSGCSRGLEKYLNRQEGIKNASVNLVLAEALIEYDNSITKKDIENFIKEAGFESLGEHKEIDEKKMARKALNGLLISIIPVILIMYITMHHMLHLPSIPYINIDHPIVYSLVLFILSLVFLIYGFDIFKSGLKNMFHKTPNMDTLVLIGVVASYTYSVYCMIKVLLGDTNYIENLYFESSVMIIYFLKLGRYIDGRSKEKTKEAIKELVQMTPNYATLKDKNRERKVTIDEIKKGDILIAKPGEKIAVDGIIVEGEAYLEESFITGESKPIKKKAKDEVIAGSLSIDGYLEYKALKIGKDSTISSIVRLVIEAANTKMPMARLADTVSSYFVSIIIVIAIIVFFINLILGSYLGDAINSFVTVLVIACPCSLGLATPLAIVVSEGLCAKEGVLVRNSKTLEAIYETDTIVFDKTGTLTYGNLKIAKIFNYSDYDNDEIIRLVASIEDKVNHPIARTFANYINENNLTLLDTSEIKSIAGMGISGKIFDNSIYIGSEKLLDKLKIISDKTKDEKELRDDNNTFMYVIENKKIIALIGIKDVVRENAKSAIDKLKYLGKNVIMLTGDNLEVAQNISNSLGIEEFYASKMPNEKNSYIKELMNSNKSVMMIGDGINDAPSLATSSVGVSMGGATDIALNSADVILLHDNLEKIVTLIEISKRTIRNIKQNLFWAFFYNICMIPIAAGLLKPFGIVINPMLASLAMTLSSLTVVFNALRLKSYRKK